MNSDGERFCNEESEAEEEYDGVRRPLVTTVEEEDGCQEEAHLKGMTGEKNGILGWI